MDERSGSPVTVEDISPTLVTSPVSDIERLTDYISGRFIERNQETTQLLRTTATLKLKTDLIALGFQAIDFRREVSGWMALARRLRDEMLADAMDTSHEERSHAAEERDLKRPNAKLVETRAKADIAPLNEAIERLAETRDEMVSLISWCQSLQRAVRDEEFGDLLESSNEVPEEFYQAPIGPALGRLKRQP